MFKFFKNCDGSMGVTLAIALPLVAALAGGAVDYSNATSKRAHLQRSLDTATLAAGRFDGSEEQRENAGIKAFERNYGESCGAFPKFDISDEGILATAECTVGTYILDVIGVKTIEIDATTEIGFETGNGANQTPLCVLITNPTGISFSKGGGGLFSTPDCRIHVNSSSPLAMSVGGGSIKASAITVVGDVNASCKSTRCVKTPETGVAVQPDPMSAFVAPSADDCTHTNYDVSQAGSRTVSPGVYCGGMSFAAGNTTFAPGIYVIRNGDLKQDGGGDWTGSGVVFRFEGSGRLNKRGGGNIRFSAPTTGAFAGIVFYHGPGANKNVVHDLAGGGTRYLEGTIYLPAHTMNYGGGGGAQTAAPWTLWVIGSLIMGGGGNFHIGTDFEASAVPIPEDLVEAIFTSLLMVIRG